jgi:YVTN family beta-propeller protein
LRTARTALCVLLSIGALMALSSCEWFYALFGDPPSAALVADPTSGAAPLEVAFDLSGSTAPGGVHRFRLDFGDGSDFAIGTETDEPIVHTYAAAGTYTAVLEVTSQYGQTDHDTESIIVGEAVEPGGVGPIALLAADTTLGDAPLVVWFDVSASSAPGSALVSFRLDFGDGTAPTEGTNFSQPVIHLYAEVGLHTASLTVTDANGDTGAATLDIVATTAGGGGAPIARFDWTPARPYIDEEVTFDAGASTDPARGNVSPRAIVVYTWDFGDGSESATTAETVDHTYTWPGTYTVTLTIYDDDGVAGTAEEEITVRGAIAYVSCVFGEVGEVRFPGGDASRAINAPGEIAGPAVVSPDGAFIYILGLGIAEEAWALAKHRTSDLAVLAEADLSVPALFSFAVHPDGGALYATPAEASAGEADVWVIDPLTLAVVDAIPVQSEPSTVAFTPNGDFAYVTCTEAQAVVKIDTASRTVEQTVFHAERPFGIAIHSDGGYAYVTTSDDHVLVLDLSDCTFDPTPIDVGDSPTAVAFTHDGQHAYVVNKGSVSVIDTSTHTVADTIALDEPSLSQPHPTDIAISPGDTVALIPHGTVGGKEVSFYVSVIDLATNTVTDVLPLGYGALFVDIWGIGY